VQPLGDLLDAMNQQDRLLKKGNRKWQIAGSEFSITQSQRRASFGSSQRGGGGGGDGGGSQRFGQSSQRPAASSRY
jgi:hypothetical protein